VVEVVVEVVGGGGGGGGDGFVVEVVLLIIYLIFNDPNPVLGMTVLDKHFRQKGKSHKWLEMPKHT
jgi:hypothetical protein